ncbi:unnamed protein product [Mytilus coruscus]|uniref:Uncharacterized protein n=1 Tax=Mytilus coruscus TaxID=42192 RepID=A0A6J8BBP4_MYTCO|nr:unnamed protein product [Mytilus coruscus]
MDVISDLSTSIELTFDVTDQVKTNIDMFRTHLDIQKCAITSCGYCPDSLPDEAKTITKCFNRNVRKYKSIIHEIRGDIVATARTLENEEVFPQMESSPRIHQQEASNRVITYQPTTFAYPHPPAPLQPQAAAYKQTAAFVHPALYSFKQPPPSPPAGSQQIYQCQEAVPLRNYPQKRGLTSYSTDYDTEISSQQTVTPAVIDTGIKKN